MLWLKAFHVIAMVTWFAGLFYLPRLFVYHADTQDSIGAERFRIMEAPSVRDHDHRRRRHPGVRHRDAGGRAGVSRMGWLHAKWSLVALLIVYHLYCYKFTLDFARNRNAHSAKWYRGFNEVPSLLLIGIVILAVVKP